MKTFQSQQILRTSDLDDVISEIKKMIGDLPHIDVGESWKHFTGYYDPAGDDWRVHLETVVTFTDYSGRVGICGFGYVVGERHNAGSAPLIGHNFNKSNAGDVYHTADCFNEILAKLNVL